ncbi:MAG: twitching motility protein PilT [Chloroflexi bacterium RBG_16_48_8]|nr:MAG: twitching motility protein PilT [Chloroflexi bacterium RBG_16_48_8]
MSGELIVRLIGMIVLMISGGILGLNLAPKVGGAVDLWGIVFALVGALAGLIITPFITTRPIRLFRSRIALISAQKMISGIIGLVVGLTIAALVASPLSLLPKPFGQILPFLGALIFGYIGMAVFVMRQNDIFGILRSRFSFGADDSRDRSERTVLLDTSVIIDGRIADIARTGFITGSMLVPSFILNELQHIADSSESLRRQRGRRGLDILNRLQKDTSIPFQISDIDVEGVREVDDKLIILAKQLRCPILTNDYNLNRVAELQGVTVLNINELANAVKAVYIPGETMEVQVLQEGKELGQGVGYLDDGTMVVIEEGKEYIGQLIPVVVTKVLQTAAGRMIFARPEKM